MSEKLVYVGSHATDDPTMAAVPFVLAIGANSADIDVEVVLIAEAVYLMKDDISKGVHPVGFPDFSELLADTVSKGIPIHV